MGQATSDQIKHEQIAEPGYVRDYALKELQELGAYIPIVEAAVVKAAKALQSMADSFKGGFKGVEDVKRLGEYTKQSSELMVIHSKIQKTKIELSEKEAAQAQVEKANKKDRIALLKAEIIELDKTVGSLQRVEAANARLRIERKGIDTTTEAGRQRLVALNAEIDRNNKYIIANSDKLKQQSLNVGNYAESIEKAFLKTGIFGATIEKLTAIYEGINSILETYKAKQAAATAAQDANIISTETNIGVTEKEIVTKEGDIAVTEANTAKTELNTVANKANTASRLGIIGAIIIGIAAITELGIAYKKSTQEGKDDVDVAEEMAKMALRQAGTVAKHRKEIFDLLKAEKALHDERTANLAKIQELETKAAVLRSDAQDEFILNEKTGKQEINTNHDKIKALGEYVDALKEVKDIKQEEAEKDYKNAQALADLFKGTSYQREFADKAASAKVALEAVEADFANSTRRARKQLASIEQKDAEDRIKLRQEMQKDEIEKTDTYSANQLEQLKNTYEKELKLTNLATAQEIENKKRKQQELGVVDAKGVPHAKEFKKELLVIQQKGDEKNLELQRKYIDDVEKLLIEEDKKRSDFNAKQADKDFKITSARLQEQESQELLAIEQSYDKQKDHSVKAEEEKQQAILAVKIKYLELEKKRNEDNPEEVSKIQKQINDLIAAGARGDLDATKKLHEEAIKARKKFEDDLTQGVADGLKTRSELQQQADQKDIDFHKRTIDVQARLAAEGKDNVLAQELAATDKAEEKKLQDAKRAQRLQEDIALVKTFSDVLTKALDSDKPFIQALGEAAGATGIVKSIFSTLFAGSFKEGVENLQGKGTETSDSNIALLSKGESVATAKATKQTPGLVTAMNKDGLAGVQDWAFKNIYTPQYNSANTTTTQVKDGNSLNLLASVFSEKIESLQKTIEDKPVPSIGLNGLFSWFEETEHRGNRTRTNHIRQGRFSSMRKHGG